MSATCSTVRPLYPSARLVALRAKVTHMQVCWNRYLTSSRRVSPATSAEVREATVALRMISVFAMGSPIVRRSRRGRAAITSSEESLPAIIGGALRVSSALSALDRRRFLLTYQQKMCFINCSGSCGHVQAAQIHLVAGRCEIRTHHAVQINESRGGSGVSVLRSKSETQ